MTLGPKTLRLSQARRCGDVRASDLAAYGVSWLHHHPYFINGERVTVVYAKPADVIAAQQILDTAESVVPGLAAPLRRRQGGPSARDLPRRQKKQAERLAHVDLGKVWTHVVTRPMLDGVPRSLLEGIAMYEELPPRLPQHAHLGAAPDRLGAPER